MKSYNEMADDVLRRVEEYTENQKRKRKAVMRMGTVAACFCIAAIVGFSVLRVGAVPLPPTQTTETESTVNTTNDRFEISGSNGNVDIIHWPFDYVPDRTGVKIISSYGNGSYEQNETVPKNGNVCFSSALQGAIDEYGDSVLYRVFIDVYSDELLLEANSPQVGKEKDRLIENDYIVAYETYFDGTENHYYFTIHAKLNELTEFKPNNNYGYMLSLYEERIIIDN